MIRSVFLVPATITTEAVEAMFNFLRAPKNSVRVVDFENRKMLVLVDETDDYDLLNCVCRIFPEVEKPPKSFERQEKWASEDDTQ